MSFTDTTRRRQVLRAVLTAARVTGDVTAPWEAVPGVFEHFADEADVLGELQHEWVRVLVARLHRGRVVATRSAANVQDLYREVASLHATMRAILDAHAGNAALLDAQEREYALLARIASVPDGDHAASAAASGRALVHGRIPAQRSASA